MKLHMQILYIQSTWIEFKACIGQQVNARSFMMMILNIKIQAKQKDK